ncbi:hypothetical protein [Staphylococcus argensis]|uniref:hypothetical protein n=1 Tax=Staphylococcus argensis TaxID=1607738 RepID=UPI0016425129|nr:hypothetical protein [Staphylococcus argensis]
MGKFAGRGSVCFITDAITAILIFIVALVDRHHLRACFGLVLTILHALKHSLIIKRMTKVNIESMNHYLESEMILSLVKIKMKTVS